MCVLAGYIGKLPAAELLLETGELMEGLWSGFYTGIGVLGEDGVLRKCKTVGYSRYFREQFKLTDLPGHCGFFHSRTNSGGDERYAHPFVSGDNTVMLCGQGRAGIFARFDDRPTAIGNMLLEEGIKFSSADPNLEPKKYQILNDGSQVHVSDIVTEYAAFLYKKLSDPVQTVRKCATDIVEEGVSLYIFSDHPGHIFVSNVNCRLAICFRPDGVLMATSKIALGSAPGRELELPCNCVADITCSDIKIKELSPQLTVSSITNQKGLQAEILNYIKNNNGVSMAQIRDNIINPRCSGNDLFEAYPYRIVEQLLNEGVIKLSGEEIPGAPVSSNKAWRTLIYPA
jgi:hypothetical protein